MRGGHGQTPIIIPATFLPATDHPARHRYHDPRPAARRADRGRGDRSLRAGSRSALRLATAFGGGRAGWRNHAAPLGLAAHTIFGPDGEIPCRTPARVPDGRD